MGCYLVTGCAGFIGAQVVSKLLERGDEVWGLDDLNHAYDPRLKQWRLERLKASPLFHFRKVDIAGPGLAEALDGAEGFDGIINLAARAGVRQSVADPASYLRTNILGALNVLEFGRRNGITKFVQASTSSLYGLNNHRPFQEDADVSRPLSPYAASKGGAEVLCHSYAHLHGLDITILRYFTVYGPAGRPDMSIFRFIQWIAEGKPLRLYGDGSQQRDFTYVEDIARGTLAALKPVGYEIINLGGDDPVSMLEVIEKIEARLGRKAQVETYDRAPADMPATWADIGKARRLLGWEPRVSLDEGLDRTIAWYQAERAWASQVDTGD